MKWFVSIFFCCLVRILFSQNHIADSTLKKLEKINSPEERMRVLIQDGLQILMISPYQGLYYSEKAKEDTTSVTNPYLLDSLYKFSAFCYGDLNNRSKTLENHLKRIEVLSALDTNSKQLSSAYFETAHVLKSQGNIELAMPYFYQCREIAEETGYKTQEGQVLIELGENAFREGKPEKAIAFYKESIEIFEEDGRYLFLVGLNKSKIALILNTQGKEASAISEVEQALLLVDTSETRFVDYTGEIFINAGKVYLDQQKHRKAITQFSIARKLYEENNKYFYLPETYKLLSKAFKEVNVDSAFVYLDWYVMTNDSVINKENNDRISQLRFEFEEEQKEKEIALLRTEKELIEENRRLSEAESERKSTLIQLGTVAIIVTLLSLFISIYYFILSKKKNKLLSDQKKIIEESSKEVNDSIAYAERIQRAVIPQDERLNSIFRNAFVYYEPKDVLSGDFYWVYNVETNDKTLLKLFAVGDCTGHGVPGALLSVLGVNYLNLGAVSSEINSPAQALDFLNEGIIQTFGFSNETIRDGMDIVIGALNPIDLKLYYACAKNPIYIVREGKLITLKGDKKAIGNDSFSKEFRFSEHEFQLKTGDMIYAFSDGYQDQFGGPNGRKFKVRQFKELLTSISDEELTFQSEKVQSIFNTWSEGYEQIDDVTLMAIRI
ncbi:MAG: SpoIIE family protein phosphatase [Crocinitomicaceae bacterium]